MENNSLLPTDKEFAELYLRHADLVYRLSYIYLKNPFDAEDAVQSVYLKLIKSQPVFNNHNHEKAWLMVTTRNYCKDILKNWWKTRRVALDALPEVSSWNGDKQSSEVLARLLSLPEKYKIVLYLYYYEEYSVKEISEMLGHKESTVQTQLSRGRKRLKIDLGGNCFE